MDIITLAAGRDDTFYAVKRCAHSVLPRTLRAAAGA